MSMSPADPGIVTPQPSPQPAPHPDDPIVQQYAARGSDLERAVSEAVSIRAQAEQILRDAGIDIEHPMIAFMLDASPEGLVAGAQDERFLAALRLQAPSTPVTVWEEAFGLSGFTGPLIQAGTTTPSELAGVDPTQVVRPGQNYSIQPDTGWVMYRSARCSIRRRGRSSSAELRGSRGPRCGSATSRRTGRRTRSRSGATGSASSATCPRTRRRRRASTRRSSTCWRSITRSGIRTSARPSRSISPAPISARPDRRSPLATSTSRSRAGPRAVPPGVRERPLGCGTPRVVVVRHEDESADAASTHAARRTGGSGPLCRDDGGRGEGHSRDRGVPRRDVPAGVDRGEHPAT